jgi:hypothetical protein
LYREHIHVRGKSTNRTKMTGLFIAEKIHHGEYTDWNANNICGKCTISGALNAWVSSSKDATCLTANNGTATIAVAGGTGPYSISWNTSPVKTGATVTGLAPGVYIATVTDAVGAVTTVSVDIVVSTFTILATELVSLGVHDTVFTGSVGITKTTGSISIDGHSAAIDPNAMVIAPTINIHSGSTVQDTVYGIATPILEPFEGNIPYYSSSDLNVSTNAVYTMGVNDTLRRKITVNKNATLVVTASKLNITDDLILKEGATVKFAQTCVKIRIKDDLITESKIKINPDAINLIIHVNSDATIGKGSKVTSTIYAPNGYLTTSDGSSGYHCGSSGHWDDGDDDDDGGYHHGCGNWGGYDDDDDDDNGWGHGGHDNGEHDDDDDDGHHDDDDDHYGSCYGSTPIPTIMTGKFIAKRVYSGNFTYWYQRVECPCSAGSGAPVFIAANAEDQNQTSTTTPQPQDTEDKLTTGPIKVSAYPNPFRDQATIAFTSPVDDNVRLVVLSPTGNEVEMLYNGPVKAQQEYKFQFNADQTMSSGIYFYRLQTGDGKSVVNKLILAK